MRKVADMPAQLAIFDPSIEYAIEARRSGAWWALTCPALPGIHSQVRRLEQAKAMIRDAVALGFDIPAESIRLGEPVPVVNPEVDELLRSTKSRRAELASLRVEVDVLSRRLAYELAENGIPVRDIASALNVSFQHAAKLAKSA
jgi:predicted RNase H-like HicB family nuclease